MHIYASLTAILLGLYELDNVELGKNNKEHVRIEERRPRCVQRQEDPTRLIPQDKDRKTPLNLSPRIKTGRPH